MSGMPPPEPSAVREHVVLINVDKTEPIALLEPDPDIRLTAVTDLRSRHMYSADTNVIAVDFDDQWKNREVELAALGAEKNAPIDHVVAPGEFTLRAGGYLRSVLGIDGPGFDVINNFTNKHVMKKKAGAAGVPVTPHLLVHHLGEIRAAAVRLGWPVVVKPFIGAGCLDVAVVRGPDDLDRVLAGAIGESWAWLVEFWGPLLVEKYVPVEAEYHCDGLVQDGKVIFAEVSRYIMPMLNALGDVVASYTIEPGSLLRAQIEHMHQAVVSALGLPAGITHMEVLEGPEGLVFGEISCRPSGGQVLRNIELARGVDMWRGFIDLSIGRTPRVEPDPPAGVSLVVHFPTEQGRVTYVTPPEELAKLPNVVDVIHHVHIGKRTDATTNTSVIGAAVLLSLDDESAVPEAVRTVREAFRMEVESDDGEE